MEPYGDATLELGQAVAHARRDILYGEEKEAGDDAPEALPPNVTEPHYASSGLMGFVGNIQLWGFRDFEDRSATSVGKVWR